MVAHTPNIGQRDRKGNLPADVIEDLLADEARRRMLGHLQEVDEPVPVDDLAALVETGNPSGAVSTGQRRRARTEIYQTHLPKLTATGTVTFDSLLGTVEFAGCPALRARLGAVQSGNDGGESANRGTKDK